MNPTFILTYNGTLTTMPIQIGIFIEYKKLFWVLRFTDI